MIAILLPDSESGIYYYSSKLYSHIPLRKEFIFLKKGKILSIPYYVLCVLNSNAKLFHIQFEPRFLKNPFEQVIFIFLIPFIIKYIKRKPLIVTFHAILNYEDFHILLNTIKHRRLFIHFKKLLWLIYIISNEVLLKFANRIIVHNQLLYDWIKNNFNIMKKIIIIPHGTILLQNDTKEKNGILYFGFLKLTRNLINIIKAFQLLKKDYTAPIKLYLLIFISRKRGDIHKSMLSLLRKFIKENIKNDISIVINPCEETINKILNRTIIGILPYLERTIESSGIAWRFAGLGIPFIGTAVPKLLSDFGNSGACILLDRFSPEKIAKAIKFLLTNKELYLDMKLKLISMASCRTWDKVAKLHLKIYEDVMCHA
ncbi:MAG: hypothetical protein QXY96_07325 [Candidatus Methanomethylicaceae archaeon]